MIILSDRLNFAIVAAFLGTLLAAGGSQIGYEGAESVDDALAAAAFICGSTCIGLIVLMVLRDKAAGGLQA